MPYGQAGAIDLFGPDLGHPKAISGHDQYWFWGLGEATGEVTIVIGGDEEGLRESCGSLERAGTLDCTDCMPYEDDLPIWVCRNLKVPIRELWPRVRKFS